MTAPATRFNKRRLVAVVTLVAVTLLAFGAVISAVLTARSGSKATPAGEAPSTSSTVRPSPTSSVPSLQGYGTTGAELERSVVAGRLATYHGVYSVTDARLDPSTTETLEVWRRGPKIRTDVTDQNATAVHRASAVVSGSLSIACNTVQGVEQCSSSSSGPIDLPEAFLAAVVKVTPPGQLTVTDATVAGQPARCYAMLEVGSMCLRADGALLRVNLNGTMADATLIDDVVTDDVFSTQRGAPASSSSSS
ncbi:MAG: hypothetical protein ACR2LQ_07310 [Acidimicrobiales bacterium]